MPPANAHWATTHVHAHDARRPSTQHHTHTHTHTQHTHLSTSKHTALACFHSATALSFGTTPTYAAMVTTRRRTEYVAAQRRMCHKATCSASGSDGGDRLTSWLFQMMRL